MSFYFLRSVNKEFPLHFSSTVFSQRFYSVLCPVHCKLDKYNDLKEYKHRKMLQLTQTNFRHFSLQSSYIKFFNFITESEPSIFLKNILINLHDTANLPWWCTIVTVTLASKLVTLPFGLYQQYILSNINLTDEELKTKLPALKEEVLLRSKRGNWDKKKTKIIYVIEVNKLRKQLQIQNNCHPFKSIILTVTPLPLWVLITFTLRKMGLDASSPGADSIKTLRGFCVEGLFWSKNLTLPDTLLILPFITFFCILTLTEINLLSARGKPKLLGKIVIILLRIFALISLYISTQAPMCLTLFWTTSIIFSVLQSLFMLSPRVRRFCRIPKTSAENDKPYSQIVTNFKEKYVGFYKTHNKEL